MFQKNSSYLLTSNLESSKRGNKYTYKPRKKNKTVSSGRLLRGTFKVRMNAMEEHLENRRDIEKET